MLGGLAAALAIILFVTAHEAGPFFAAKATGMKVTQFFFGFGPKIWSTQRGETEYGFKWLPLGGYVRIIGMNPLEEVEAADMGRTYREKKFWEKSVVVLAGVGMNFLIAFLIFYAIVWIPPVPELVPQVTEVVAGSPADDIGIQEGDVILELGGSPVEEWSDIEVLAELGPGPTTIVLDRSGQILTEEVVLAENESDPTVGFLGVRPEVVELDYNAFESVGVAGRFVWSGIGETFEILFNMIRPSSFAQYFGVLLGDTDVPDNIRPVSPVGIVNIGAQVAEDIVFFAGILATVNVILATINLLPLFPLDGGHFTVALYEKVTGREANIQRLVPVAAAVIGLFAFLGFVAIILDVTNPIDL